MTGFGLFRAGQLDYALPLGQIRKIVQDRPVFFLPELPAGIDVVLVDESALVPVLLTHRRGTGSDGLGGNEYYVLVDSEYGLVAFATQPNSRIILEHKGKLSLQEEREVAWQIGCFAYAGRSYQILDVDVLAMEITRGNGSICLMDSGVRRLNEEEAAVGR